jgi:hypothetical protein
MQALPSTPHPTSEISGSCGPGALPLQETVRCPATLAWVGLGPDYQRGVPRGELGLLLLGASKPVPRTTAVLRKSCARRYTNPPSVQQLVAYSAQCVRKVHIYSERQLSASLYRPLPFAGCVVPSVASLGSQLFGTVSHHLV